MAVSVLFRTQRLHMGGPGVFFEWRCIWVLLCFFISGMGPERRLNVHVRGASGNRMLRYGARAEIEHSGMRANDKSYARA